eukprot:scaffold1403_cov241-Pinguiococcus_pyrenoidosus.AAC.2
MAEIHTFSDLDFPSRICCRNALAHDVVQLRNDALGTLDTLSNSIRGDQKVGFRRFDAHLRPLRSDVFTLIALQGADDALKLGAALHSAAAAANGAVLRGKNRSIYGFCI